MADVFVSYSRHDAGFVHELHAFLTGAGRDVWVDWEDIPAASNWEQDIDDSIDAAESVVFVVSPSSLASEYCGEELRHAGAGGKRVVPLAIDGADPQAAPPALRQLNWIWCRETDDREAAFAALGRALDTDLEWSRAHTRLLVRAVEWDTRRDKSLLLRGKDLEAAERQLAAHAGKDPRTTELQQQYVHASRRGASRRQRGLLGGVTAALAVSVALGVVALLQRNTAEDRARIAESQALSLRAIDALETSPEIALGHAVDAFETERTPEARSALRRAILANPIELALPAGRKSRKYTPPELAFSRDGRLLLALTPYSGLRFWRSATGDAVARTTARRAALGPGGRVLVAQERTVRLARGGTGRTRGVPAGTKIVAVGFSGREPLALVAGSGAASVLTVADGRRVRLDAPRVSASDAVLSGDGRRVVTLGRRARVWDTRTGRQLAALPRAHEAVLSGDGRLVAVSGDQGTELYSVAGPTRLARLGLDVARVVFAPAGDLALAVASDGEARVYRTATGRLVTTFPGFGALGRGASYMFRPGAAVSEDGSLVAVAAADGFVRVWELATRKQVGALRAGWATELAFAPRGGRLAAMTWDGDVVVAHVPASLAIRTGFQPTYGCGTFSPSTSPDGGLVAAPVAGGAGLWRMDGGPVRVLRPPARVRGGKTAGAVAFSGDGRTVAARAVSVVCFVATTAERMGVAAWRLGGRSPLRRVWSPRWESGVELDRRGSLLVVDGRAWPTTRGGAPLRALDGIIAIATGANVAVVARGRETRVVEVPSGRTVSVLDDAGRLATAEADVASVALSPAGDRVLSDNGGVVRLWDAATGQAIARLDRPDKAVEAAYFAEGGRRVNVLSDGLAAAFDAASGRLLSSWAGRLDALSDDGMLGVVLRGDGGLDVVELEHGLTVTLQTDTAVPLTSIAFTAVPGVLVAGDEGGDVHVVRCAICAPDDELLRDARETLTLVSGLRAKQPPKAFAPA